ncbi:serine hydrolase [Kitasatospora saccharophila]
MCGHPERSFALCDRADAIAPAMLTEVVRAGTWRERGDHDRAAAAFERALLLDPANWSLHLDLADLDALRGDFASAAVRTARGLELEPAEPTLRAAPAAYRFRLAPAAGALRELLDAAGALRPSPYRRQLLDLARTDAAGPFTGLPAELLAEADRPRGGGCPAVNGSRTSHWYPERTAARRGTGMPNGLGGLDGLDEACERVLAETGCPSVSVAVAAGEELVLARAYGWADVAAGRPATPGTAYGLASVTKAFTGLAACLAADRGLLDLDAPLAGEFAHAAPTVRQLLRHRGGFPGYYDFSYRPDGAPGPIDLARYRRQLHAPDGEFEYSNIGYQEVARALEAATGRELGALLREWVAEPLGLAGFAFGPVHPGPAPAAVRYTPDGRAYPPCREGHPAAGAGWATAGDVALFARRSAGLLAPGTAAAVLDAPAIAPGGKLGYGLGRVVQRAADGSVCSSHGGGMGGVAAMMIDLPGRGLSVAVLANSTDKSARNAVVAHLTGVLAPEFDPAHLAPVDEPDLPLALPAGRWSGEVATPDGAVPLALAALPDGLVEVRLADLPPVAVPAAASRRWDLRLIAELQLPTADARLNSPAFGLQLRLQDGGLTGRALAFKNGDREGFLGPYLPHPCELRRRG